MFDHFRALTQKLDTPQGFGTLQKNLCETDRESRLGGLVLMGVSSSELLSSSSDSSDWISSTMERRGPGRCWGTQSGDLRCLCADVWMR